ncbi:transcription antitermination factor NusB [Metabacillus sp. GX 13764]|uniref:transcription antitermination factor NusB n=1 Tax=Metabacillus kandeliae TaxID=2900151 RepID=UPI001E4DF59A|nr:transcription antitermination factor NusB [Metabacillus kandeliae]MCD7033207.1 transcription antitermination factor NusB [Metabacillus kandeliae]
MNRRAAREKALQALFQIDVSEIDPVEAIKHVFEEITPDLFTERLVFGTLENQSRIDEYIKPQLVNWTLERIANVDRAILRLAVYEMAFEEDIPVNVSIDEGIELAKSYGDDHSAKFVNGVLSNVKKALEK